MLAEMKSGVEGPGTRIEKKENTDPQKNYRKQGHWEREKAYPELVRTVGRVYADVWMGMAWGFGRHHKNYGTVRQKVIGNWAATDRKGAGRAVRVLEKKGWLRTEWNGKGKPLTYILDGEMKVGVGEGTTTERKGPAREYRGAHSSRPGCAESGVPTAEAHGVGVHAPRGAHSCAPRLESLKKLSKETLSKKDDEAEEEAEKTVSIEEKEPEIWAPGGSWDGLVWYEARGEGPRLVPWREHPEAAGEDLRACEEGLREGREWEKGWGPARAARCFRIEKEIEEKYR